MVCPNCHSEVGTLRECPYCGQKMPRAQGTDDSTYDFEATIPLEDAEKQSRHMGHMDVWGLMTVILLGGIFLMEFLQLIMMFEG
ncbi:MAG: hypothetical protein LUE87_12600 [Lachnospiraceae bacterium]|nr:hypothetical protein [Lachnospiraceae bacterium]